MHNEQAAFDINASANSVISCCTSNSRFCGLLSLFEWARASVPLQYDSLVRHHLTNLAACLACIACWGWPPECANPLQNATLIFGANHQRPKICWWLWCQGNFSAISYFLATSFHTIFRYYISSFIASITLRCGESFWARTAHITLLSHLLHVRLLTAVLQY